MNQVSLNRAAIGSILIYSPLTKSKPEGLFIHPLAATINIQDISPEIPTIIPDIQWAFGEILSHPYRKIPRAMASIEKAVPSRENGMTNIGPACSLKNRP